MTPPQRSKAAVGAVPEVQPSRSRAEPSLARLGLLPLAAFVIVVARYGFGASFTLAMAAGAPLVLLFAVAPVLAARSRRRFERGLGMALARGQGGELEALLRAARAFRWFGSPGEVAEKEGLVASEAGDHARAKEAYARAAEGWRGPAPMAVELGFAHACFELGEDAKAVTSYRRVLAWEPTMRLARERIAQALLRAGLDGEGEAHGWLEGLEEPANEEAAHRFRMLRAAAARSAGEKGEAKRWLKKAGKPRDEEARALRALARD